MSWYDDLPKVELHIHLEGAIPHEALFELLQKYGGDPSVPDVASLERKFKYRDFPHFIETWSWKNQFLRTYEDFEFIAELTARDMAGQNIRYAEMFFSPSLFTGRGLSVQQLTASIRNGLSAVPDIRIALIADLVRNYGPDAEMSTLHELNEVRDCGVIGIGIGGSEHEYPPEPFKELYITAREMGFRTTAHAGEASGPRSIRGALFTLGAERIGHGTSAIEDRELVEYIAENEIPLELCPISNVRTGAVRSIEEHPIREYFDRGLRICVNTDDPKMFNTSLVHEYRMLEERCGFSRQEICEIVIMGIRSSWLPEVEKNSLTDEFQQDPAWMN